MGDGFCGLRFLVLKCFFFCFFFRVVSVCFFKIITLDIALVFIGVFSQFFCMYFLVQRW